jgi:hypothetical protein
MKDWITDVLARGHHVPALQIIEETNGLHGDEREAFWIGYYAGKGCHLLNTNFMPKVEPARTFLSPPTLPQSVVDRIRAIGHRQKVPAALWT